MSLTPDHDNPNQPQQLSRRELLIGLTSFVGLTMLNGGTANQAPLPDTEAFEVFSTNNTQSVDGTIEGRPITNGYLQDLFCRLQDIDNTMPDGERIEAVNSSLHVLHAHRRQATAFQIDQSGLYLTAKHALPTPPLVPEATGAFSILDPATNDGYSVQAVVYHPEADAALVYAPNGQASQVTHGIGLSAAAPEDGTSVWSLAFDFFHAGPDALAISVEAGTVDSADLPLDHRLRSGLTEAVPESMFTVRGLEPTFGRSGGPTINEHGIIVGILVKAYRDNIGDITAATKGTSIREISKYAIHT